MNTSRECTQLDLPVVHTMWLGTSLSRLELLTLCSLVQQGHHVKLWTYDSIRTSIPKGVELDDAERIFPRSRVRPKKYDEPDIGIGAGSVGGVFSDLFRYRVLYEFGGIWADLDVTALKPFAFPNQYAFRPHHLGVVGSIMKCPRNSSFLISVYEATEAIADEYTPWLRPVRILNACVREANLIRHVVPDMSNHDKWEHITPLLLGRKPLPQSWYAIHWMNERWRTISRNQHTRVDHERRIPEKNSPFEDTTLHDLYKLHGLCEDLAYL